MTRGYAFVVDYSDPQAQITRKYQLLFYLTDNTVEMIDIKSRRMFLKRTTVPAMQAEDLYLGAQVIVHARHLTVVDYADEATRRIFASKSEGCLALIKPDGYENIGHILRMVFEEGLRVHRINMLRLTLEEAANFFAGDRGKPHFQQLVDHCSSYPLIAAHLVGERANER